MLDSIRNFTWGSRLPRLALISATMGIGAVVSAQTTLPVTKTFQVQPSSPLNTATLKPQIDKTFRPQPVRPENELSFKLLPPNPNNKLAAGGMIPNTRASLLQGHFPAIGATGWTPPDPDMGVGPTHVVVVVNSSIGFFRKDGTNTFLRTSESFFAGMGAGSFQFDPKALYDPISKRFFILFLEMDGTSKTSKSLIAVSDDSDPNGTWYRYRVESKLTVNNEDHWLDYPGWGVSQDYLGFCGNMFGFGNSWAGNQFVLINKGSLLTGGAANVTSIHDPNNASVKICQSTDLKDLLAISNNTQDQMRIYSVAATGAKSTVVPVPAWRYPQGPVQGPSQHNLDSLDGRLFNAFYKGGNIVTTHGISPANDSRIMSRWYDFKLNGFPSGTNQPTLTQSGNVAGPVGTSYHMPAVARNKRGEIALVFSRTSQSIMADLMVTGHKFTDAPGVMGAPVLRAPSEGLYGGSGGGYNRWGDYFGLAVDPTDDVTFWALGMTGRSDGNWQTHVFPFKITSYDDLMTPVSASAMVPLANQGKLNTTGTTRIDLADGIFANVDSQVVTGVGLVSSLSVTANSKLTAATIGQLRLNAKFTAPTDATTFYYLYNVNTRVWDQLAASPSGQSPLRFDRIEGQASPYIAANGDVKFLARVVRPNRSGTSPYTLRLDQFAISVAPRL